MRLLDRLEEEKTREFKAMVWSVILIVLGGWITIISYVPDAVHTASEASEKECIFVIGMFLLVPGLVIAICVGLVKFSDRLYRRKHNLS